MSKGQVFVMSAVIFSALALLAITSTQQTYTSTSEADIDTYFQSVLTQQPEIVDAGLKDGYSIESVKKKFYTFNRFVERRSRSKSISYEALQLIVLPEKDRAVVLNYRPEMTSFQLEASSWYNHSLNPYQNTVMDVEGGEFYFNVEELDVEESFNASRPTMFTHVRMESGEAVLTDDMLR